MIRSVIFFILCATGLNAQDRLPNHLLGTQSPYLQQHLYNPVDWYPWGPEALERARLENKMIFVSIGYSSCHWCHVMREESFEDPAIAAFLNEHFISIKIDRERRPDLDEQFMLATQVLTGSGGWPNNLVLTPLGDPFFAGTYFPPDALTSLLQQLSDIWRDEPEVINAEGFKLALYLKNYLTRTAAAVELTPALLGNINMRLLNQLDDFNGGMGTAPKFPRESLFLFLMDQARRNGDPDLLQAVTNSLNGMVRGGIHDHVGGGFHRYAIDPEWHVPHFEKMLYNQAMIGLLLARSVQDTADANHARALERLIAYSIRKLRDQGGAFYAAEDADSYDALGEKHEGAFYVWSPEQIAAISPDAHYLNGLLQITNEGELEGENVLHLPEGFRDFDKLDPMLETLRLARDERIPPTTDTKILMGWNGMMIAMLAEASHAMQRPDYWQTGADAARFILSEMKADDGYHRVIFEGSAGVPAQLGDLGALALGLIALHDYAPDNEDSAPWLVKALYIANIIRTNFGSAQDGYTMTENADGFSSIIAVDDGELPSGNALALLVFSRISKRMEAPDLQLEADLLAAAISGHAAEQPEQRAASLTAIQELHNGETGPVRFISSGAVRIQMTPDRTAGELRFDLTIKPGWHINAHVPLEDYFIPTDLVINGAALPATAYPDPVVKSLGFNEDMLALHEGTLTLRAPLSTSEANTSGRAILVLQACSDEICLAPEELTFTLW